jgi:predicted acyltransferase
METMLWESDIRLIPAGVIAVLGVWLTVLGAMRQVRALRLPVETAGKNHRWLRAMRQMIQGIALLAIGLGWAWQLPVMIAAGAIFGFEETIETSIATWALKQEAEGKQGYA